MRVSVVIATYNGERFIEEQIRSIACQTIRPDEIVVRDDCSTDGTVSVVEALRDRDMLPIKLIRGERNVGYAKNFIEAISHATGSYIFLADQDDYWLPEKVARFLHAFAQEPCPLVLIADQMIADGALVPAGVTTIENTLRSGRSLDSFVHGCCTAFDSRISSLVATAPEDLGHDDWIHMIGSALGGRVVLRDVCQVYRRHLGAVTSSSVNKPQVVRRKFLGRVLLFRDSAATRMIVMNLRKRISWIERLERSLSMSGSLPFSTIAVDRALSDLASTRRALMSRVKNVSGKSVARLGILACWWRGEYTGFKGAGIAIRDLLSQGAAIDGGP